MRNWILAVAVFALSSACAPAAGQSSDQKPASAEWTGRLDYGVMAVGGETTGIVLTTDNARFELEPADAAMRNQMKDLDKKQVVVRGTLRTVAGVEIKERHIIKVTSVSPKTTGT